MHREEAAEADLAAAIAAATNKATHAPKDWQNELNLAVYYLAVGNETAAEDLYRRAIASGVVEGMVRMAITDLDDYSHLFPTAVVAQRMRALLAQHLVERTQADSETAE
jgi:hypothetical protein